MLDREECSRLAGFGCPCEKCAKLRDKLGPSGSALADFCARAVVLSEEERVVLEDALWDKRDKEDGMNGDASKARICEALRARLLGGE